MITINNVLDDFYKSLKQNDFSKNDIEKIKKAWNFAKFKHGNQLRKSGELYIIHPLETAKQLLEWKMDKNTIIAGLLHDVLEDTKTKESEIKILFGNDVLSMVIGVTKVSTISNDNRSKDSKNDFRSNESLMKVLLSISSDIRIIIIKLADRLHNMKTIKFLNLVKQKRIAKETFDIFANIAGRIGMYDLKTKLLDLSFAILYPIEFEKTKINIENYMEKTKNKFNEFNKNLENLIKNNNIEIELKTRTKGIYSTNKKMTSENIRVNDIYDVFASRIIIKGNQLDCYKILGIAHLNFTFLPKRFKDYISSPKLNLYQSLHTIIVYEGIYIELQIRNKEMDDLSTYGLASHWRYKENKVVGSEVIHSIVNQVAEINDNQSNIKIKNISKNKFFDVLVLNNNKWYISNQNQTILDIAYKVDSENFLRISSLMKDYKKVSFNRLLKPGNIIEINYSIKIKATIDWLDWCTNDEAKNKINSYFSERQNENEKIIKDFFIKIKEKLKNECATEDEIRARVISIDFKSLSEFINFLNEKEINFLNPNILNFCLVSKHKRKILNASDKIKDLYLSSHEKTNFFFKKLDGIFYKKALYPKCCSKVPGIDCVGVLDKWVLNVHKYNCKERSKNKKEVVLHWDYEKLENLKKVFNCTISFEINKNISNKIINSIIETGLKIIEVKINKITNEKWKLLITVNVNNLEQVQLLIDEMEIKFLISTIEIL